MNNPEGVEFDRRFPHHGVVPQSLGKILVPAVFSTKQPRPFLRDKSLRHELHRFLVVAARRISNPLSANLNPGGSRPFPST
jgi:hypothetical protein